MSNKTIIIEGNEYKTDEKGYIHTDPGFTQDLIASIDGRNYTIKPSSTYLTLTVAEEDDKRFNCLYIIIQVLVIAIISIVAIREKEKCLVDI